MLLVGFGVGLAATYLFLNKKSEKSDFLGFGNRKKRVSGANQAIKDCRSAGCTGWDITRGGCYGCPEKTVRGTGDWVGKPCRCFDSIKYDKEGRPQTGYGINYGTFIMSNGKLTCDCTK